MSLVYVTGVPGTGKSTICEILRERGHTSYDIDTAGLTVEVLEQGEPQGWALDPDQITRLKGDNADEVAFVCGTVRDDAKHWNDFDLHFALLTSDAVIEQRLIERADHPFAYGKTEAERTQVLERMPIKNGTYAALGAIMLDATLPPQLLTDAIISTTQTFFENQT